MVKLINPFIEIYHLKKKQLQGQIKEKVEIEEQDE